MAEQSTATMSAELPKYLCHKEVHHLCHKEVHAFQIIRSRPVENGVELSNNREDGRPYVSVVVSREWMARHEPKLGGYYVVYEDGYASYSPMQAFEAGYTLVQR